VPQPRQCICMSGMAGLTNELLRRHDRAGPRYTSYPTAPQFNSSFGEAQYREHVSLSNAGRPPHALSLYVHIPFCYSPCFYCGCNRIITHDAARGAHYLNLLKREIDLTAPLFDRGREVVQLHLGGGTPNFLQASELGRLIGHLARHFDLSGAPERDFSIEIDPRFIAPDFMASLASLGFNRASLGVQDFDAQVQQAINRRQSIAETLAVIETARASGFRSINVDLIYGLPKQTSEGFARTLETIVAAQPERIAIYGYAHLPELFKAQRRITASDLPSPEMRVALLRLAIERLSAAGYRYIGMDHFALPEDDLARAQSAGGLQRNFMGYTTHADCDLVGFGMSAISHVGHSFSQNFRDMRAWAEAVDAGHLPVWRGLELDPDDVLRAHVIQQIMCCGEIDIGAVESRFGVSFASYFADALENLQPLIEDELVAMDERRILASTRGRLVLRNIAMCFDRYLNRRDATGSAPRFSKVL